ncbi:NYN domain-containing protein [Trinickia terrae]|uniref:NYN domain-containing protein n=1 Tax=Trinickia terrae TaxID=2571161 RepID=A0A4U1HYY6_9BURK|nr:NYN domain-containing protein [Trinickia terrae]TKC85897.1 NYN domain-containing protein [Trinickia terrae]
MALPQESVSMALFCDFENVALGVRDAKYEKFDIKPVLERLLLKGSIVVKKAYCDWDRYKTFKAAMHEASFELIEIPHVRQSGKNSADIRLVVDALDLCYTKSHVDTFVIISGDSDFSPLVSKLRENAKKVIGVGVKNSTSDLLVANCDEFIFYDDLVREQQRAIAKREAREASAKRSTNGDKQQKQELEGRKAEAIAIAVETFEALVFERGESGKIWASVLKSAIKRRKPDFSESYYGFRTFGNLLDEAQSRGLLEVGRDDKSGAFVYRISQGAAAEPGKPIKSSKVAKNVEPAAVVEEQPLEQDAPREAETKKTPAPRRRRKTAAKETEAVVEQTRQEELFTAKPSADSEADAKPAKKAPRKSASRAGRSRKAAAEGNG